jgi:hypothetical protein
MFYTVAAAAKATGLSKSAVLAAIETGRIAGTKDLFGEWEIEHSDLHRLRATVGEPGVGSDGAQQHTAPDAANLEVEIFPEHAPWSATPPQGGHVLGSDSSFPTVLIAGALLAALGLGWIGGSSSSLFPGLPVSASLNQGLKSSSRALGSENEGIGVTPAENRRDTIRPGRAHGSPQGPAQPIAASADPISSAAQQGTTSPNFAGTAVQQLGKTASRPKAVPETRPATIEGWMVRDVVGGKAVLEGPNGIWKVTRGDTVPGVGTVESIVRWGNRWIVATSGGLITTQ